jgi:hypothetical protein
MEGFWGVNWVATDILGRGGGSFETYMETEEDAVEDSFLAVTVTL